jgi:hypothetical protein
MVVDNGDLKARVGGVWTTYPGALPAGATKVWGCSATNAWITVGSDLWHWDGATATQDGNYTSNAFSGPIQGISGSSCTDVWTAHDFGTAHFDGTNWSDAHTTGMSAVVSRSAGLAWLLNGTTSNRIGTPDGNGWEVRIPTQNRAITAAWRLANGNLLVGGNGFLLFGGN